MRGMGEPHLGAAWFGGRWLLPMRAGDLGRCVRRIGGVSGSGHRMAQPLSPVRRWRRSLVEPRGDRVGLCVLDW